MGTYLPCGRIPSEVAECVLEPVVNLVERQLLIGRLDNRLVVCVVGRWDSDGNGNWFGGE